MWDVAPPKVHVLEQNGAAGNTDNHDSMMATEAPKAAKRPRGRPKRNSVTQDDISNNYVSPNISDGRTPINFASNNKNKADPKVKRGRGRPKKIKTEPGEVVLDQVSLEQVQFGDQQFHGIFLDVFHFLGAKLEFFMKKFK